MYWWYYHIFSEKEIFNAVKNGRLENLKSLLEGKHENNPVISTLDDGTELRVLDKSAFFGHLNVMIWYTDILGYTYNATSKIYVLIHITSSDAGRWKTLGVPLVIGGDNLASPVRIG